MTAAGVAWGREGGPPFSREVTLPWEVDPEQIHAETTFKNGVLTVDVPRPAGIKSEAKKIAVKAS